MYRGWMMSFRSGYTAFAGWILYYELKKGRKKIDLAKHEAESLVNFNKLIDQGDLRQKTRKHYRACTAQDLARRTVLTLLEERFHEWQKRGFIPSRKIEPGAKTDEPIRTRGWTHWHHLFTPRQLLVSGLYLKIAFDQNKLDIQSAIEIILELGRLLDTKGIGSRLLRWNSHFSKEMHATVFSNQALNTLFNYCSRSINSVQTTHEKFDKILGKSTIEPIDSRMLKTKCEIWITDPPYADAIKLP